MLDRPRAWRRTRHLAGDTPMVERRAFLIGTTAMLAAPLTVAAQPAVKSARVGWIAAGRGVAFVDAFREGMRERGWVEGRNLVVEVRSGDRDRAADLAAELVRLTVHVLVAQGPMVFGAQAGAGSTPVVFGFSGDPVEAKLVTSLARPGGHLTGVSLLAFELVGKRLELLKDVLPGLTRVAVLANVAHPGEQAELRESRATAARLGLTLQYVPVRSPQDFEAAFQAITLERAEAIVAFPDLLIMNQAKVIAEFAARRRVPAVSGWPEFAAAGNLMTYGPNLQETWRHLIATYVDRILRGARPGDLPVGQPTTFALVINMRTAKALGLTIPPSVLLRADQIID